jgi:hypothetical protein
MRHGKGRYQSGPPDPPSGQVDRFEFPHIDPRPDFPSSVERNHTIYETNACINNRSSIKRSMTARARLRRGTDRQMRSRRHFDGRDLLELWGRAYQPARAHIPDLSKIIVAGPRIDPESLDLQEGVQRQRTNFILFLVTAVLCSLRFGRLWRITQSYSSRKVRRPGLWDRGTRGPYPTSHSPSKARRRRTSHHVVTPHLWTLLPTLSWVVVDSNIAGGCLHLFTNYGTWDPAPVSYYSVFASP